MHGCLMRNLCKRLFRRAYSRDNVVIAGLGERTGCTIPEGTLVKFPAFGKPL